LKMNEAPRKKGRSAAYIGVATVALASGYMLRGATVTAQDAGPQTPVVQTTETKDATAIQNAFSQVSSAIEPAVVTITTEGSSRRTAARTPGQGPSPFGSPFGGPGGPGGNDPLEDLFRRFREFGGGIAPNSYSEEELRRQFNAGLRQIQQERRGGGLGSGMIIRQDGLIITNAHVVGDAKTVTVTLNDEREFRKVPVLGRDERTDIAVVKIPETNLPTVKLGDSSKVRVGDWAIAVGNPFGLAHTVTVGVISAKAREVQLNVRNPGDYLQTDASINPGNSGGPLCDIQGRVIGVNNAIYSQSGGNVGIGFAIPINTARDIAERLVKDGRIARGYLGVQITDVDAETAEEFGLPANTRGVMVRSVESKDTPGAKAGLQPGDVILSFNDQAVTKSSEIQRLVGNAPVNSTVQLKVLRDGQNLALTARLDELKSESGNPPTTPARPNNTPEDAAPAPGALGLSLQALTPQLAKQFGVEGSTGVLVSRVVDGSDAEAAGLQRGDVIERVGQVVVTTPQDATRRITSILNRQTGETKRIALFVNRKGTRSYITVTSGE
jgi:serine protease Do